MESADTGPDSPTWIDTGYVQNALQRAENYDSIKISNITIEPATKKGDNFLSDIYRVGVNFSRILDGDEVQEKQSLIVKIAPMSGIRKSMITASKIFDVEISMMLNTLPRMNEILIESDMAPLSPRCLLIERENPIHLLFEDLVSRGFQLSDRRAGLDLDHCLIAFRNLGRFHASSLALKEKDAKALREYTMGTFHKDRPAHLRGYFEAGVKALANEVCKWHDLSPRISEKLFKLSEVVYEKGCEVAGYREDELNVLNHGDFSITNMLFSYDELRKPIQSIFVDFQFCHYGSPAVDILYFFGTSPSDHVRLNHRDLLIREYYNSLTSTMAKLKCNTKAPSFDNLQEILRRRALYEAIASFIVLPTMLLDKCEMKNLDDVYSEADGKYDNPGYRGSSYRKVMTRLLPLYDSMGLFDDRN